jgi:hypothetical protein
LEALGHLGGRQWSDDILESEILSSSLSLLKGQIREHELVEIALDEESESLDFGA